jgi:Tfp pilus assembly protein PilO
VTDLRRIVSENRRVVWTITAALVVNAALYVLVVYPLSGRVQAEQQESGEATRQLIEAQRTHAAARGTVTGKKQADEELQRFYRDVLAANPSGARKVLYPNVDQLARNSNLTPFSSQWEADPRTTGELRRLGITLTLEGEYPNIRRFIHELETAPEFLVLESVIVTQQQDGERNLNVTARVATYYRHAANGS